MESGEVSREALERVVWEAPTCPLCGARGEKVVLTAASPRPGLLYRLVRCGACSLGYLSPRPDRASVGLLYADDYHCYHQKKRPPGRLRRYLERRACSWAFGDPPPPRGWAERFLGALASPFVLPARGSLTRLPYHGQGRLLDFGCGAGWFSRRMQQRGWRVTAMDPHEGSTRFLAEEFGLTTLTGTLPHPQVREGSFDVVVMGASLEHVHCPHEVVGAARRALAPGGLLVLTVPNLASRGFAWFGEDWYGLHLPFHLLHFTEVTLCDLMRRHGLEVVSLRSRAHSRWACHSLDRRRRRLGHADGWPSWRPLAHLLARRLNERAARRGEGDDLHLVARWPGGESQPVGAAA
jgi:SAM-dependent methyltransferase